MTGWRLGYGVMPRDLADHVARLMVNTNSCTASFTQWAGIAALQGDQPPVHAMVAEFKRRRDLIVAGLNELPGVTCRSPRGAFYVFPNVSALGRPSAEVAGLLLNEAGVAVLGGRPSASTARATCGCPTPTPRPTSARRWSGCGRCWPGSPPDSGRARRLPAGPRHRLLHRRAGRADRPPLHPAHAVGFVSGLGAATAGDYRGDYRGAATLVAGVFIGSGLWC